MDPSFNEPSETQEDIVDQMEDPCMYEMCDQGWRMDPNMCEQQIHEPSGGTDVARAQLCMCEMLRLGNNGAQ